MEAGCAQGYTTSSGAAGIWTYRVGVLSPRTWPPCYRTSPGNSTRMVSFTDITPNGMDPQKTQGHHYWVFSEEYPGSGPKTVMDRAADVRWVGPALCRQRQSLLGDAKGGNVYLDLHTNFDKSGLRKRWPPRFTVEHHMSLPKPSLRHSTGCKLYRDDGWTFMSVRKSDKKCLCSERRVGMPVTQIVGLRRQNWEPGQKLDHWESSPSNFFKIKWTPARYKSFF